jgi:hypothetical protein
MASKYSPKPSAGFSAAVSSVVVRQNPSKVAGKSIGSSSGRQPISNREWKKDHLARFFSASSSRCEFSGGCVFSRPISRFIFFRRSGA